MVKVAIAGGTGGLGRTVTEAIAATGKHDVYVLSRKSSGIFENHATIKVVVVDYSSPSSIASALAAENIDTVISTLGIVHAQDNESQLNLIEGAIQSKTVKRFAPSEFGIDYLEAQNQSFPLPTAEMRDYKVNAVKRLRGSGLTFIRYLGGFFLDYYGFPRAPLHIMPFAVVLDIENAKAAIPGDGNAPVVLTHTKDIGAFVAASLDLDEWPEKVTIVGNRLTWNEALAIAESARGQKFDVVHDSLETLMQGNATELPANVPRYSVLPKAMITGLLSIWGLGFAHGWFDVKGERLNDFFPELKPITIETFLETYWKSK